MLASLLSSNENKRKISFARSVASYRHRRSRRYTLDLDLDLALDLDRTTTTKRHSLTCCWAHQMQQQLTTFKENLEVFASKHKREILANPELRQHFQTMCSSIGVDPLACTLRSARAAPPNTRYNRPRHRVTHAMVQRTRASGLRCLASATFTTRSPCR